MKEAKEFLVASLISLSIVLFIVFAATPLTVCLLMYNFGEDLIKAIIVLCLISAIVGGLLVWLLPELWEFLKPILHAATA